VVQIGAHPREQLDGASNGNRPMARLLERGLETIAHEPGVVGYDDGLGNGWATRHLH
jgi:hypothetical protein